MHYPNLLRLLIGLLLAVGVGPLLGIGAEPTGVDLLETYRQLRTFSQPMGSGPSVGDVAPVFNLISVEGESQVRLDALLAHDKPVAMVFGSLTCGPFCRKVGALEKAYQELGDRASFVMVYIRDAHPNDHAGGRQADLPTPPKKPTQHKSQGISQPTSLAERQAAAWRVLETQGITFPTAIDTMNDRVAYAYAAFPDRLYVIGADGKIVYKSAPGPHGFKPAAMITALRDHLGPESNTEPYPPRPVASVPVDRLIFDGQPKTLVVNGYSTSLRWPALLQERLDRQTDGQRLITVRSAVKGSTPIAKWIDVTTGKRLDPWRDILTPAMRRERKATVIVLAQQSLQWAFGSRREGIRNEGDQERVTQGADVFEAYTRALLHEGADAVFLASHIYKQSMEPLIGNERLALRAVMGRGIEGLYEGPDVWAPTRDAYPQGFWEDRVHPNELGAELMAHAWFATLLKHDGVSVPAWSEPDPANEGQQKKDTLRGKRQPPQWLIDRYDTNGDGRLSAEERSTARAERDKRRMQGNRTP